MQIQDDRGKDDSARGHRAGDQKNLAKNIDYVTNLISY